MRVTVNSVDGNPPPSWVTPNPSVVNFVTSGASANCTISAGSETCTLSVPGPPGTVSYTFDLFDGSGATGNRVGAITQTVAIAQGQTTPIDVTIAPVVASVSVSGSVLVPSTATPGTSSAQQLTLVAKDADGNVITGSAAQPADNAIELSVDDQVHAASLSAATSPSCPGTASVTLTSPQQSVWLCYTGQATANVSITAAQAPGGAPAESITGGGTIATALNAISVTGTTPCTTSAGCLSTDPNYNAATVFFTATSGSGAMRTLSASELGWTQAPYNQQFDLVLDPVTCGTGSSAVIAPPVNPSVSWTLTAQNTGICKGTLTEHSAAPLRASGTTVWFSVTSATGTGF